MSVRNLAVAGLASFALGGPLLLRAFADAGALALVGLAGLWLGLLLMFAAVLQLGRTEHRMLRTHREATRQLAAQVAALGDGLGGRDVGTGAGGADAGGADADGGLPPAVVEQLGAIQAAVAASLDAHRRELLQVVDARVLGIHETVRDLGASDRA